MIMAWLLDKHIKQNKKKTWQTEVYLIFCFAVFLFKQSKNDASVKPRTREFQKFIVFNAKAKDFRKCL